MSDKRKTLDDPELRALWSQGMESKDLDAVGAALDEIGSAPPPPFLEHRIIAQSRKRAPVSGWKYGIPAIASVAIVLLVLTILPGNEQSPNGMQSEVHFSTDALNDLSDDDETFLALTLDDDLGENDSLDADFSQLEMTL